MRRRHYERGSSMVEFAIAAAATLLLLFGIIEFGRALYVYHSVANAARLGARWAMVRGSGSCSYPVGKALATCPATQTEIQDYVQSQVPVLDTGSITISATWPGGTDGCQAANTPTPGCLVQVTATHNFHFAIPYISTTTLPISSTSQMIIAQ